MNTKNIEKQKMQDTVTPPRKTALKVKVENDAIILLESSIIALLCRVNNFRQSHGEDGLINGSHTNKIDWAFDHVAKRKEELITELKRKENQ